MAWTTPLTATSNATLTAAQWNASVRDNLLESAPAKATTAGRLIVTTGTNSVTERAISSQTAAGPDTNSSVTYAAFSPAPGPAITVTTGTSAIAFAAAQIAGTTNGAFVAFGVAVSSASSIGASDADGFLFQPNTASAAGVRGSVAIHYPGTLTAGSNIFTMQGRASAGTITAQLRKITVLGL